MSESRGKADAPGTSDRFGPECREGFGGSVIAKSREDAAGAIGPARASRSPTDRTRARSISRVLQSIRAPSSLGRGCVVEHGRFPGERGGRRPGPAEPQRRKVSHDACARDEAVSRSGRIAGRGSGNPLSQRADAGTDSGPVSSSFSAWAGALVRPTEATVCSIICS